MITVTENQVLRLFFEIIILLVVFAIALMSDIGLLWSFLASWGSVFWFRTSWKASKSVLEERRTGKKVGL